MAQLGRVLVPSLGAMYLALYGVIVLLRIAYPYELDWLEGGTLDHVRRLRDGLPLYGPPDLTFTPFLYSPPTSMQGWWRHAGWNSISSRSA